MESNDKTKWINTILSQLRELKGSQTTMVLENCGRECLKSSSSFYKRIQKLRNDIEDKNNIEIIFSTYKEEIYKNSPTLYKENGDIYLEYQKCGCGMVTDGGVTDPFLCNCTVGYTKQIFETLFGRPVTVKLLKAILNGDSICKQKITVKDV